jgi:hypothetical protein
VEGFWRLEALRKAPLALLRGEVRVGPAVEEGDRGEG